MEHSRPLAIEILLLSVLFSFQADISLVVGSDILFHHKSNIPTSKLPQTDVNRV